MMPAGYYMQLVVRAAKLIITPALAVFLFFYPADSYCQSYSYAHYDVKDGLPSTIVYDITQDNDGFIWFGTENGLCRFDGKNFTTFTMKDGLPDNSVLRVCADKYGRVFFSPFTHPPYYYYRDSIYKLAIDDSLLPDITNSPAYFNWRGYLVIVGTTLNRKNIYLVDAEGRVNLSTDLYPEMPLGISTVNDSTIISSSTKDSLFLVEGKQKVYVGQHRYDKLLLGFTRDRVPVYAEDVSSTPIYMDMVTSLRNGMRYAYNNTSVFLFNIQTGKLLYKLDIEKFNKAFVDNESNLWITTVGNGVYRFPSMAFRHVSFSGNAGDVYSISQFNNQLVMGSEFSKTFLLGGEDRNLEYAGTDYSKYIEQSGNNTSHYTRRNRVYKLLEKGNALYVGTDAFTLKLTPGQRPVFRNIFPVKDLDTLKEKLLICLSTGVMLVNTVTMDVEDTLFRRRATTGVFYAGDYYIGTYGGLIKIDARNKTESELGYLSPALKRRIVSVRRGSDNDLWIATSGSGVVRMKEGKVVAVFNAGNGLTSDMSTCMLVDGDNIWVGTNKGLNRIILTDPVPRILQFTTSNGLAADFINTIYVRDSMIYAGSAAGLTFFNKYLSHTPSVCLLQITHVSKGNEVLKKDSVYSFPYGTMNIRVDFTAISFKSAGENKYYYRLQGLDTGWNVTTNSFINYATLPPKKYTLLIYAVNKFGVISVTRTVSITIVPPWWQRWWFITAAALAIALVVLLIYRRNIRSIKRQEENKRKNEARLALLEQQALQAQMNPHFIFNCLNSIQSYILDLDAEGANKYLTAFASMIRQTLDNSSHPLISVADETKYLDTYLQLEKLRFKEKFNYEIIIDDDIDKHNVKVPGMLLQPYIENSLRHGIQHRNDNLGVVSLEIAGDDQDGVICTIRDNGVGRKRSEEMKSSRHIEYQSKGTFINQKRVIAINSQFKTNITIITEDITDSNGDVSGTMVQINIPAFANLEA
jgi:two-component sensor histidine kinase